MGKIIWAINATIDGYADHTTAIADDELHDFYTDLLKGVDIELFGRKTYELLESFWPTAAQDPSSNKSTIDFANAINPMQKIVFTKTIKSVKWNNTTIKDNLIDEVLKLKKEGKTLGVGGISIARTLLEHDLIDEFWFLIQPILAGKGIRLVDGLTQKTNIKLIDTRTMHSGVVVMHYQKI